MAAIVPPAPWPAPSATAIGDRRQLLTAHGIDLGDLAEGQLGIAFSGGGIRSATISLGVAQALAKEGRLLDFDYMSTVSGGGYFGSFLRSLFLPQSVRGSGAKIDHRGAAPADTDFALTVLGSEPDARMVSGTGLTNPIRWLRENSRYLAPAGPTDYAVAATYIVRNWLAMLFVFALPTLLFFMVIHGFIHGLADLGHPTDGRGSWIIGPGPFRLSALFVIPAVLLLVSIVIGVANWLTVFTSDARRPARKSGAAFPPAAQVLGAAAFALVAGVILHLLVSCGWNGEQLNWRIGQRSSAWPQTVPIVGGGALAVRMLVMVARLLVAGAIGAALVAMAATLCIALRKPRIGTALFGHELRRAMTAVNADLNVAMVVMLVLAVVDTVALELAVRLSNPGGVLATLALLAPLGRWLIQKIQASFGKSTPGGTVWTILTRYIWQLAFVAAALLWGGFAVLLDVLVRALAYVPGYWLAPYGLAFAILAVLLAVIGAAVGFINLSSLHAFYAARLTRAFLGATNQDRLDERASRGITGYQNRDIIRTDIYQQQICAAPLHLMNVTLNETISATGSQLLERDRKGIPMVIAPEGIWIDAAQAAPGNIGHGTQVNCSWNHFTASTAEPLSVGQIAAISGAAFSSAMGARTTLGGALLFTYANIRLGYWWNRGTIRIASDPAKAAHRRDRLGWTGTFGYLLREMTARYRSTTSRVNLSDGGHFDNTGVYELLRRKIPTILLCDNGEDAGYHFEDLENLVRKARLDIGVSVEVASAGDVLATMGTGGARSFLNGRSGDWRARARTRSTGDAAFALLLLVRDAACAQVGTIVLLKPSLFGSLPADVWGYAEQHVSFPHESTSDQFFTEAQWESYRKLGFMMMQQLLVATPHKQDLFRRL